MIELIALFRKEMLEIFGNRQSRRGGIFQGAVLAFVLGVVVHPHAWLAGNAMAMLPFAFLPGVAATTIAADAFAGERERGTLDTLLASPLAERTILFGKMAAAVMFGTAVGAAGFFVAVATINMGQAHYVPPPVVAFAVLGASLASALLNSAVAIVVSMFVPVARASQQIATVSSAALLGVVVFVGHASHIKPTWDAVLIASGLVALVALAVLEVANATFRRDRFFKQS